LGVVAFCTIFAASLVMNVDFMANGDVMAIEQNLAAGDRLDQLLNLPTPFS